MQISHRQELTLVHIVLSALILIVGFFSALFSLLPESFSESTLYYLLLVPYALSTVPFASTVQDPHALPTFSIFWYGFYALVIYGLFFALVLTFVGRRKILPLVYIGTYITLVFVCDLFGHLL